MSMAHTLESITPQQNFTEKLAEVQEWLTDRSIEYRIIGSAATAAYLDPDAAWALNLNRSNVSSPADRIPDIDLIVPRDKLPIVRKYREAQLEATLPVNIGLSFPSRFIDLRPGQETSFLTSSKRRFPIETNTLQPEDKKLLNQDILVPNATTLYYTYLMVSGDIRPKYRAKASMLRQLADPGQTSYINYARMIDHRRNHPNLMGRVERYHSQFGDQHPDFAKRIHKAALPLASLIGAR